MINQFINLPTLNFADLDLLFSIISGLDAIKVFFVNKVLDKENLLILGDDLEYNNALTKTLNISQEIITANDVNKINCQFLDFYLMINSSCLILSNSSFSLWAGYLSNAKTIFYPKPLFPYPRHHSVSKLTYEDLIMPIWNQYDSFL